MKVFHPLTLGLSLMLATLSQTALAHKDRSSYGRVLSAEPVYETRVIREPAEHCRVPKHRRTHTVVGGAVGAAIGLRYRHNTGAAIIGGLIGAGIGHGIDRRRDTHQHHCSTSYQDRRRTYISGYRVTYRHHGVIYTTMTDHKPGRRIELYRDKHRHKQYHTHQPHWRH